MKILIAVSCDESPVTTITEQLIIQHDTRLMFSYLVSKFCRFQRAAGGGEMWDLGSHSNTAAWGTPMGAPAQRLFKNFGPNPLLPSLKTSPAVAQALCEPEKVFLAT